MAAAIVIGRGRFYLLYSRPEGRRWGYAGDVTRLPADIIDADVIQHSDEIIRVAVLRKRTSCIMVYRMGFTVTDRVSMTASIESRIDLPMGRICHKFSFVSNVHSSVPTLLVFSKRDTTFDEPHSSLHAERLEFAVEQWQPTVKKRTYALGDTVNLNNIPPITISLDEIEWILKKEISVVNEIQKIHNISISKTGMAVLVVNDDHRIALLDAFNLNIIDWVSLPNNIRVCSGAILSPHGCCIAFPMSIVTNQTEHQQQQHVRLLPLTDIILKQLKSQQNLVKYVCNLYEYALIWNSDVWDIHYFLTQHPQYINDELSSVESSNLARAIALKLSSYLHVNNNRYNLKINSILSGLFLVDNGLCVETIDYQAILQLRNVMTTVQLATNQNDLQSLAKRFYSSQQQDTRFLSKTQSLVSASDLSRLAPLFTWIVDFALLALLNAVEFARQAQAAVVTHASTASSLPLATAANAANGSVSATPANHIAIDKADVILADAIRLLATTHDDGARLLEQIDVQSILMLASTSRRVPLLLLLGDAKLVHNLAMLVFAAGVVGDQWRDTHNQDVSSSSTSLPPFCEAHDIHLLYDMIQRLALIVRETTSNLKGVDEKVLNGSYADAFAENLSAGIANEFLRGGLTASGTFLRSASTDMLSVSTASLSAHSSNGIASATGAGAMRNNSDGGASSDLMGGSSDPLLTPDARRVRSSRTWLATFLRRRGSALAARAGVTLPRNRVSTSVAVHSLRSSTPAAAARAVARHISVGAESRDRCMSLLLSSTGLTPRHRGALSHIINADSQLSTTYPPKNQAEKHEWSSVDSIFKSFLGTVQPTQALMCVNCGRCVNANLTDPYHRSWQSCCSICFERLLMI